MAGSVDGSVSPGGELAIRLRRAAFNQALAAGDLAAIGPLLAPGVVLVTGTDSAVLAGRKAQLQAWKREFAAPAAARNHYIRTPGTVTLAAAEPLAMEHGEWTCTVGAAVTARGTYAAKWRRTGEDWVIEAELFVTLG